MYFFHHSEIRCKDWLEGKRVRWARKCYPLLLAFLSGMGTPALWIIAGTHGRLGWVQPSPSTSGTTGRLRPAGLLRRGQKVLFITVYCRPPPGASVARRVSSWPAVSKELSLVTQLAGPLQSLSFRDFHSVLLIRRLASASLGWWILMHLGVYAMVTLSRTRPVSQSFHPLAWSLVSPSCGRVLIRAALMWSRTGRWLAKMRFIHTYRAPGAARSTFHTLRIWSLHFEGKYFVIPSFPDKGTERPP